MTVELDQINAIPAFSSLLPETRLAISRRAFIRTLPIGNTLILEGAPAEYGYFILDGEVRALRMNPEGRIQVLARFSVGDPLNIISLLSKDQVNRATLETLSPVTLLALSAVDFSQLTSIYADFSSLLLQFFAERLTKITNLAADLSLYAVRARLARFLIELADLTPSPSGWTQDEIAAHIGSVRDVVGRLLRDFEAAGLIQRQRGQIILLDRQKLMAAAQDQDT
ncbi:MAG: Crp/Fnr family transcriptional regulator [Brevefilum sp.]|nr:Crp/Fnr family transcriptional regulator [Brevefilum sp.]